MLKLLYFCVYLISQKKGGGGVLADSRDFSLELRLCLVAGQNMVMTL